LLMAGQTDVWVGKTFSLALLGIVLAGAILTIFAQLGPAVVLMWPAAGVVGYALIRIPRSQPVITFDRLWIGGMLAYLALARRESWRSRSSKLLVVSFLWLLVSFGLRAAATSSSTAGPIATWIDAIVLPAILLIACERYAITRERFGRLAGALMIAGGILGVIGIAERIWGFDLSSLSGAAGRFDAAVNQVRVSGPYPAPEPYALSLIVCLAATLYWVQARKRSAYAWGVIIAGLEIAGIALSLFRAAWLGALLVVIASFGIRPRRLGRMLGVLTIVAAVALAATSQLEQNQTFGKRARDTNNIYGRLATYQQGLQIFRSAPVFGVGVDQYPAVAAERDPVAVSGVSSVTFPHSSYIGLLAEQGLVGFLPLMLVTFAVWRVIRALGRAASTEEMGTLTGTLTGAALGYLVMSLTLTMLPYEASNAFFAVLLGAACGRLNALNSATE
jgi:hypothetical protein